MASEQKLGRVGDTPWAVVTTRAPGVLKIPRIDKVPRPSISNVIWILSFDTGTSVATPLGPGARKVLA